MALWLCTTTVIHIYIYVICAIYTICTWMDRWMWYICVRNVIYLHMYMGVYLYMCGRMYLSIQRVCIHARLGYVYVHAYILNY